MSWLDIINASMGRSQDTTQDNNQENAGGSSDRRIYDRRYNGEYVFDEILKGFVERDN